QVADATGRGVYPAFCPARAAQGLRQGASLWSAGQPSPRRPSAGEPASAVGGDGGRRRWRFRGGRAGGAALLLRLWQRTRDVSAAAGRRAGGGGRRARQFLTRPARLELGACPRRSSRRVV